jgi:hypothetical protein
VAGVRLAITTMAPSRARSMAAARPMPALPPVTTATLGGVKKQVPGVALR